VTRFDFVSPIDRQELHLSNDNLASADGSQQFDIVDDIAHLIRPDRVAVVNAFADAYAAVRVAEGRGSQTSHYYRGLPYSDLSGNFVDQWAQRAKSYELLVSEIGSTPLDIVDAGSGNCWLAARLASKGHNVVALDVNVDASDGLGARIHYEQWFEVARAELTAMPIADSSVDVVVFNASAHYLCFDALSLEAERVLRPGGRILIADSPLYADASAGDAMVSEMGDYIAGLGVVPAAYEGPGYLTEAIVLSSPHEWSVANTDQNATVIGRLRGRLATRRTGRELARMPLLMATIGGAI